MKRMAETPKQTYRKHAGVDYLIDCTGPRAVCIVGE